MVERPAYRAFPRRLKRETAPHARGAAPIYASDIPRKGNRTMKRNVPRLRLVVNRDRQADTFNAFDHLTTTLIMAKAEVGTLDSAIVAALLVGVGMPV